MRDICGIYRYIDNIHKQANFAWTYGQSGFSMHITDENKLILGAPGIENWRGSVIEYSDKEELVTPLIQETEQKSATGHIFNKTLVVRSELSSILENGSYFGYAVTSGKFFKDESNKARTIQYVSGAPRGI